MQNMYLKPTDEPYAPVIEKFIHQEFPRKLTGSSPLVVDLIADEIMGTKNTRYGAKPSVETQFAIREVIREKVSKDLPIPFMVPWGSQKPGGGHVDIAELGALRVLANLHENIKEHYNPGAQFNIRVEDVSAPWLYFDDPDTARQRTQKYTAQLSALNAVLSTDRTVRIVNEASLTTEETFASTATDYLVPFLGAIRERSEVSLKALTLMGWSGGINQESMDYYMRTYQKLYPSATQQQNEYRLARYYAGALARKRLGIRGDDALWEGKFVDLSFVQPIPGTSATFGRRVFYRTIPGEFTTLHIPPWRAKGYLSISKDDSVTPKLTTWSDKQQFHEFCMTLQGVNGLEVNVQADYILE